MKFPQQQQFTELFDPVTKGEMGFFWAASRPEAPT
jgi:hypothetical protein